MWRLQCIDGHRSFVWDNTNVPLCDLNEEPMLVSEGSMPRHGDRLLRPNILMFDDYWFVSNSDQICDMARFEEQPIDTVILIGSDCGVPTNVLRAAACQKHGAKVICINPSVGCCGGFLRPDIHLLVGARDGLTSLASLLDKA